jgi:acyl carrier protein
MDTLTVIREFLVDRLEIDPARIQPEATLEELQIDSLMLVELIFECEEKYNVVLSGMYAHRRTSANSSASLTSSSSKHRKPSRPNPWRTSTASP